MNDAVVKKLIFNGVELLVSSDGKVQTQQHLKIKRDGRIDNRKGRVLKPSSDKNGYLRVTITNKDVRKSISVHRLVALAFIKNPLNKLTVNHKNGIKYDNNVSNLEWATHSEQKIHSIIHHLCDNNIIALTQHNKLTSKKVNFEGVTYNSIREASRITGKSQWEMSKYKVNYEN